MLTIWAVRFCRRLVCLDALLRLGLHQILHLGLEGSTSLHFLLSEKRNSAGRLNGVLHQFRGSLLSAHGGERCYKDHSASPLHGVTDSIGSNNLLPNERWNDTLLQNFAELGRAKDDLAKVSDLVWGLPRSWVWTRYDWTNQTQYTDLKII